jgi:hypothetical protein
MKKTLLLLLTALTFGITTGAVAHNHDTDKQTVQKIGDIQITNAYIASTTTTDRPSVAYFTLENTGKTDDTLVSVTTDIAKTTQIHETKLDSKGVMSMNHLSEGIKIPAGKQVELKPKGLHLMLVDLTKPLKANDTAVVTLNFEQSGTHKITLPIKDINAHHQCPKNCKHCKTKGDCKGCKHCQGAEKQKNTTTTAKPQQCHHH